MAYGILCKDQRLNSIIITNTITITIVVTTITMKTYVYLETVLELPELK